MSYELLFDVLEKLFYFREIIQLLREYFFSLWQTLPSTGDKLLEYVWPFVRLGLKGLLWGSLKLFAICWSLNESLFLFCINSSLLTFLHENLHLSLQVFFQFRICYYYKVPLKTWPWFSSTKSLYCWQSHCSMPVSYVVSSFV